MTNACWAKICISHNTALHWQKDRFLLPRSIPTHDSKGGGVDLEVTPFSSTVLGHFEGL